MFKITMAENGNGMRNFTVSVALLKWGEFSTLRWAEEYEDFKITFDILNGYRFIGNFLNRPWPGSLGTRSHPISLII